MDVACEIGPREFYHIRIYARKELVEGVPVISHPKQVCEGCMVAKQSRKPFPREASWRASKPLELVYADLCGPVTPQTKGGNRYFMLIVDDYCRFMWVYLLKSKDEALIKFKDFISEVKKQNCWKIRMLRTDRGGEFTSEAFNQFCDDEGIKRQLTAPYTPQQNGVVERRIRTVMEVTRSLLKTMAVPETLWGEAVRQAVYILNRISTKGFKNKTPYEGWKGKKPKLHHVRVFGCVGYVKRTGKHLGKLCDRSVAMVYLGAEAGSKILRMYNPNEEKVCVVRNGDVEFDEFKKWVWKESPTGESILQPSWATGTNRKKDNSSNNVPTSTQDSDQSTSKLNYDHTPLQGLRSLNEVYERTEVIEDDELLLVDDEPTNYKEAVDYEEWKGAMASELESIERNQPWSLVDLPVGHKAIGLKWVYKLKRDPTGQVTKCKARLVAKGYVQRKGIDFDEVFAPAGKLETIRSLLAMAVKEGWFVHHLDVKSAFLHGELLEEAPRAWNARLNKALKDLGFSKCAQEQAVYTSKKPNSLLIVGVYVDDLIMTGSNEKELQEFKGRMMKVFEMTDLGLLSYYLGIEVDQKMDGITLRQSGYAKKILKTTGMSDCNTTKYPMEPKLKLTKDEDGELVNSMEYRRLIGSLRYLIHTRPDLGYSTGVLSRFMEKPRMSHLSAMKQVLRYVKGSVWCGLQYRRGVEGELLGYSDSSHGLDVEDRRGTTARDSESTVFETAHGIPLWEFANKNPRFNEMFNDSMASDSRMMSLVVKDCHEIFEGVESLVDVGGGTGVNAKILLEAFPHMTCTVFDLPHVVADMIETRNLKYVGGDMFRLIPSVDAIFLKVVQFLKHEPLEKKVHLGKKVLVGKQEPLCKKVLLGKKVRPLAKVPPWKKVPQGRRCLKGKGCLYARACL
ncbi:hypothetical protein L1987_59361 [Smallanthus sonchifolius]|uniref:Uncharacterized protein n=1 Tax=Smallanthus sonchifolius TaxID=185202 RepID=A0ACB9D5W7_9ASTR|nr:hypothetical protein L1987_59361 [Smallanthus sonchifolius]